jgi:hypothetical protein
MPFAENPRKIDIYLVFQILVNFKPGGGRPVGRRIYPKQTIFVTLWDKIWENLYGQRGFPSGLH